MSRRGRGTASWAAICRARRTVSGSAGTWTEAPLGTGGLIQVGYYHVVANDTDEAVAIAKRNPEFEFTTTAQVEVRMIKGSEAQTGFVYPR